MKRVWVDTDIALGAARGDVDDGFALAAIMLHPRRRPGPGSGPAPGPDRSSDETVELLGVSVVSGNTDGLTAARAARDLLDALGTKVDVVSELEAPRRMASLSEGTSIVAIGPPANLVRAAELDPAFPARVSVRVVGSVLDRGRHPVLGFFDLNFHRDRAATKKLLSLPWRELTIFPLDVVAELRFGAPELAAIRASSQFGAYLADHSARWLRRAPLRYLSTTFPVWDLVAALDAIDELPGRSFTAEQPRRLRAFNAEAARERFLSLLRAR